MRLFYAIFLILPLSALCQQYPKLYISNGGSDANPGTSKTLPRKTINGSSTLLRNYAIPGGKVGIGLLEKNVFNESFTSTYPITVSNYALTGNQKEFAIFNGTEQFDTGWIKEQGSNNIYKQDIFFNGFRGLGINNIGEYSFIYPFEIDRQLEATAPYTCRKPLTFVTSLAALESTPGSFYEPITTADVNPKTVYIHTSDDISPNNHPLFRYEVNTRDRAVNCALIPNCTFENLWVRGYGAGHGMLPGGSNNRYNKVIFGPGAGIHHVVVASGTINQSLFLRCSNGFGSGALTFYSNQGQNRRNKVSNTIFLDVESPIYIHTSNYYDNYAIIEIDNVISIADTNYATPFMAAANTDSVSLNHLYTENHSFGFSNTSRSVNIQNCVFKDVSTGVYLQGVTASVNIENTLIRCSRKNSNKGIDIASGNTLRLSNSIIHFKNLVADPSNPGSGFWIANKSGMNQQIVANGNIFIAEVAQNKRIAAANTNSTGTSTDKWDYNVYILLKGKEIHWTNQTSTSLQTITTFQQWQQLSGQDQHSIFFDLRNDPRGLKAIFNDPDNGDYELANTIEGKKIRLMNAGMTDPLTCFIKKPTYEEAAELIRGDTIQLINGCRTPCINNTIRGRTAFKKPALFNNGTKLQLQWVAPQQQNVLYYEIEKAENNPYFRRMVRQPVHKDSLYTFIDNDIQPNKTYNYKLIVTSTSGSRCTSPLLNVLSNGDSRDIFVYPNPSSDKISVVLNGYSGSVSYIVTNTIGQVVIKEATYTGYGQTKIIDIKALPKGLYNLTVKTEGAVMVKKLVVQ